MAVLAHAVDVLKRASRAGAGHDSMVVCVRDGAAMLALHRSVFELDLDVRAGEAALGPGAAASAAALDIAGLAGAIGCESVGRARVDASAVEHEGVADSANSGGRAGLASGGARLALACRVVGESACRACRHTLVARLVADAAGAGRVAAGRAASALGIAVVAGAVRILELVRSAFSGRRTMGAVQRQEPRLERALAVIQLVDEQQPLANRTGRKYEMHCCLRTSAHLSSQQRVVMKVQSMPPL